MGLGNYVLACNEFLWELKESLTREDVDELKTDCAVLGLDGWLAWEKKYFEQTCDYVQATPSQRLKKKVWRDSSMRRRLILASIRHVQQAKNLLEILDERDLSPGKSYRYTAALAGFAYLEIFSKDNPLWPFPGKDPFLD